VAQACGKRTTLRHNSRMHEDLVRKQEVAGSSDRSFGLTMATVAAVIGVWPLIHGGAPRWWLVVGAIVLLIVAVASASLLAPANRAWSRLGQLLGRIVSPVALAILFYLVFTPIAVCLRMTNRADMRRPFDPSSRSYWVERDPPGPLPNSLTNQF